MRVGVWFWVLVGRYWSWDFLLDLDFRLARNPVFWLVAAEIEVCFSFPWDNCTLFYLLLAVAGAGIPRAGGLFGNGKWHCFALSVDGTRDVLPLLRECCGFPLAGYGCGFWGLFGLGCGSSSKGTVAGAGKLLGVAVCRARRAKGRPPVG